MSKDEARGLVRLIRSELAEPDSSRVRELLASFISEAIPKSKTIVVFDPMPGEVNVATLGAGEQDHHYALSRTPDEGFDLTVHPVGAPMERHRYGYNQPTQGSDEVADTDIGAVVVPALAFDVQGQRLGRGRGYYDRLLDRLPSECLRIGVTGDLVVDSVPVDPHDIAMTHLVGSFGVRPVPLPDEFVSHRLLARPA